MLDFCFTPKEIALPLEVIYDAQERHAFLAVRFLCFMIQVRRKDYERHDYYTIRRGDSWIGIAKREFSDMRKFIDLQELNPEVEMEEGNVLRLTYAVPPYKPGGR